MFDHGIGVSVGGVVWVWDDSVAYGVALEVVVLCVCVNAYECMHGVQLFMYMCSCVYTRIIVHTREDPTFEMLTSDSLNSH